MSNQTTTAVIIEFAGIAGLGSAQTEEIQVNIQRKEWDLDAGAAIRTLPQESIVVHRTALMIVKNSDGTNANLTLSYNGAQIFQLSTADYNWSTEAYYTASNISTLFNDIYTLLTS